MKDRAPAVQLRFLGHAAFDLTLGGRRLCLDPHRPGVLGGRMQLPAIVGPFDALIMSHRHEDHAAWSPALGTQRVLDADGRFGPLSLRFRPVFHDPHGGLRMGMSRMASIEAEGLRVVHLGDIGAWGRADVDWLRGADLLLVPVGGTFTLGGAAAAELVQAAAPRWAVPMHAADPRVDLPLQPVDAFLDALGWPALALDQFDLVAAPPNQTVLRLAAP